MDLTAITERLSNKCPVFHSESDFQHAIAWEVHEAHGTADIRLLVPFGEQFSHQFLDLLVHLNGQSSVIKYHRYFKPVSRAPTSWSA